MTELNKIMLSAIACCLLCVPAFSQKFGFHANIQEVKKSGFYEVAVSPEISSHTRTDFTDLRIRTDSGVEVARIMKTMHFAGQQSSFIEFPITCASDDTSTSVYIFQDLTGNLISNLRFVVSSANALRYATISGSNDSKRWFSVTDHFLFDASTNAIEGHSEIIILIPSSRYLYYKLAIHNGRSDPLHISKIGTSQPGTLLNLPDTAFLQNPNPVSVSQTDSANKRSYIKIVFANSYHVDGLQFHVDGAKYFERSFQLYRADTSIDRKLPLQLITSSTLSSFHPGYLTFSKTASSSFLLVINNEDNPPLRVTACDARQMATFMVAWFDSGKKYSLLTGNAKLEQPVYDLQKFSDSIPKFLPALSIGTLLKVEKQGGLDGINSKTRWWIWPSIFLALITLAMLSWKLLQDIKHSKK